MQVEQDAPLVAQQEILINAPVETIWRLQSDINRWPEWQPDVSRAQLQGELKPGTMFRWKAAGMNIVSTLQIVEPPHAIGWTGDSLGMRAVHIWHFEPTENGVRVRTEESLSGWLARLLKLFDRRFLEKSLKKSLETLRAQAEQV